MNQYPTWKNKIPDNITNNRNIIRTIRIIEDKNPKNKSITSNIKWLKNIKIRKQLY